jgi:hypothetical protein
MSMEITLLTNVGPRGPQSLNPVIVFSNMYIEGDVLFYLVSSVRNTSFVRHVHSNIPFWHVVCCGVCYVPTWFWKVAELDATSLSVFSSGRPSDQKRRGDHLHATWLILDVPLICCK